MSEIPQIKNRSSKELSSEDNIDITFFVPCLNEEASIVGTIETIKAAVKEAGCTYEILIIDDKSIDNTISVIEEYQRAHPEVNIRLIKNSKTRGLGFNYVEGAFLGKGKYYKFVGASNQETKDSILVLLKELGKADIIIPYLVNQKDRGLKRRMFSSLFAFLVRLLSGYPLKYYNGSAIHLRYNVMRWHPDTYGYAYQAELIVRLLSEGKTYIEVPMLCIFRKIGKTKAFRLHNFLSVSHSLLQILLRRVRRILFKI